MTIEGSSSVAAPRRIRLGMVGGGQGAFIGGVHRIAARLDDRYELVAGALSSDAARAARERGRAAPRARAQLCRLSRRWRGARRRATTASTSSPSSRPTTCTRRIATRLSRRRHRRDLRQADDDDAGRGAGARRKRARRRERLFALTHNYSGYPMVRQAREMVAAGELGEIRVVQAEYPQDWLSTDLEVDRPEAGRVARRSGAGRRRRLARRHRHAMPSTWRAFITRPRAGAGQRRPARPSSPGRRLDDNVPCAAALHERRARHALGEPGRARQRERAARARLRQQGRARVLRRSIPTSCGSRRWAAAAADHPRRRRRRRGGGARHAHPRRAIPRATSKASPSSTATWPSRSRRAGSSARPTRWPAGCRAPRTARAA